MTNGYSRRFCRVFSPKWMTKSKEKFFSPVCWHYVEHQTKAKWNKKNGVPFAGVLTNIPEHPVPCNHMTNTRSFFKIKVSGHNKSIKFSGFAAALKCQDEKESFASRESFRKHETLASGASGCVDTHSRCMHQAFMNKLMLYEMEEKQINQMVVSTNFLLKASPKEENLPTVTSFLDVYVMFLFAFHQAGPFLLSRHHSRFRFPPFGFQCVGHNTVYTVELEFYIWNTKETCKSFASSLQLLHKKKIDMEKHPAPLHVLKLANWRKWLLRCM